MKERVITFGDEKSLVGILAEPGEADEIRDAPCVLILNSGILHHVGPFRLHVDAARYLAAHGYRVLRFDVAGIGDSLSARGADYDEDRVIADVRTAMDELENKKGIHDFVLMGLCTGAANSHKAAIADDRVKGGIFLDGYAYPTWRFYIRRYLPAVCDPVRIKNILARAVRRFFGKTEKEDDFSGASEDFGWWRLPPKDEIRKDLAKFVDRGVDLLYVHSGDQCEVYNYQNQFADAFSSLDFKGKLKVIINDEADHTYIMAVDRDRLINQVTAWLDDCYTS